MQDFRRRVLVRSAEEVLVAGGTGFVGRRVVDALELRGARPWRLSRVPGEGRVVVGELADVGQLESAVAGVRTIVHCASYTGRDADEQWRVNVEGTQNLIAAARAHEVRRLISLSTSGVYGGVLGAGHAEGAIPVRPGSSSARSRAAADSLVTAAGGTVVRPNLVFGTGDRRTITALLAEMVRLEAWIGDPDALVSVIDVETLGRLVAGLVSVRELPRVLHAAYSRPVRVRQLVEPIFRRNGMRMPERCVSIEAAAESAAARGVSRRQLSMVAMDNWFNCDLIWDLTHVTPPPTPLLDAATLDYYASCLRSLASVNAPKSGQYPRRPRQCPAPAPARE